MITKYDIMLVLIWFTFFIFALITAGSLGVVTFLVENATQVIITLIATLVLFAIIYID